MSRDAVGDGQSHHGGLDLREGFGQKSLSPVDDTSAKDQDQMSYWGVQYR